MCEMIEKLCNEIEAGLGRPIKSPRDFDWLSGLIFGRIAVRLSPTTLKRTWGYLRNPANPSRWTLDALAQFAGYTSYEAYCSAGNTDAQSNFMSKDRIDTDMLPVGKIVRLTWLPDRMCHVRHEGNGRFTIVSAKNSKLSVGDTFTCHLMIQGEPLYLDELRHEGLAPTGYVAGKIDGVTIAIME